MAQLWVVSFGSEALGIRLSPGRIINRVSQHDDLGQAISQADPVPSRLDPDQSSESQQCVQPQPDAVLYPADDDKPESLCPERSPKERDREFYVLSGVNCTGLDQNNFFWNSFVYQIRFHQYCGGHCLPFADDNSTTDNDEVVLFTLPQLYDSIAAATRIVGQLPILDT